MTRAYRRWTPEEDAQLLFLREHVRVSFGEIDQLLGRARDAARGRYCALRPRSFRVVSDGAVFGRDNIVVRAARLARARPTACTASSIGFVCSLQRSGAA